MRAVLWRVEFHAETSDEVADRMKLQITKLGLQEEGFRVWRPSAIFGARSLVVCTGGERVLRTIDAGRNDSTLGTAGSSAWIGRPTKAPRAWLTRFKHEVG